eukprot:144936-Heterocapsa_arctica.AAC.1
MTLRPQLAPGRTTPCCRLTLSHSIRITEYSRALPGGSLLSATLTATITCPRWSSGPSLASRASTGRNPNGRASIG